MFRTLLWKEWRQLRQLRWVGTGLAVLLPIVALFAPRAARHGWIPFVGVGDRYSASEILLEALPLALGLGLWPLIALLMTAQSFAGDRAAGTESFVLERPVPRGRTWLARTVASFGSTLVVLTLSFVIWIVVAAPTPAPSPDKWSVTVKTLVGGGSLATAASLLGGMIAASLLSAPLAALLLGVVLVMVPIFLASTLAAWFPAATIGEVPVGMLVPALLLVAYPLGSWVATCRGEPAGRGRIRRGIVSIGAGLLVVGLVFVAWAPLAVRTLAMRLDRSAELAPSPAGPSAYFVSSRGTTGGWIVDLETGDRLRFLAPPVWDVTWNQDGSLMGAATMSGSLGSATPTVRLEFYDPQGRTAGRTLHYEENTWPFRALWVGDRVILHENQVETKTYRLRLYDPATGESSFAPAPDYLRMTGFAGPTLDGRVFAVIRKAEAAGPYGLYPVNLESGEIGSEPLLEDVGQAWTAPLALSPSGRYWILDRSAGRDSPRPILDLRTGEEIFVEGVAHGARWLDRDLLYWVEQDGPTKRLVTAQPGGVPRTLKSWSDVEIGLQVSPGHDRLLVTASKVLEEQTAVVLEQRIVQTWVYDPAGERWTELTAWPDHPYRGYAYATMWAGPRTIARTGPGVLVFENLERPGESIPVIGSLRRGSETPSGF